MNQTINLLLVEQNDIAVCSRNILMDIFHSFLIQTVHRLIKKIMSTLISNDRDHYLQHLLKMVSSNAFMYMQPIVYMVL